MRVPRLTTFADLGGMYGSPNYASGLCMPESRLLAGLERLYMNATDCMYGDHRRDINPRRTSSTAVLRQIHARAGIIITTGEDSYLTTATRWTPRHGHVSHLLNDYFGGRPAGQLAARAGPTRS